MESNQMMLTQIVEANKDVQAAWFDNPFLPARITVIVSAPISSHALRIPAPVRHLQVSQILSRKIQTLRAPATNALAANVHQACQNEPIKLGTQIQPSNANWVGTAGAPIHWMDNDHHHHYGILSNWHVMADGVQKPGRSIHQPDRNRPAMATLVRWSEPVDDEVNIIDAAIADALVDGFHTISPEIIGIGRLANASIDAEPGLRVMKAGRTTQITHARCIGVGASVRVSYGDFVATFEDQDIFRGDTNNFSAPGDSGSLIIEESSKAPVSLLFAGSTDITIGNPIREVEAALSIDFRFP